MAEALLNQFSNGRLLGLSAGSRPSDEVHPVALTCLERNRTPVDRPRSKSWDEFDNQSIDLVITVCDNAASEACPVFQGRPAKLHWGLPDPAKAQGTPDEIFAEFQAVYDRLLQLINELTRALDHQTGNSVEDGLKHVDFQRLVSPDS